MKRNLVDEKQPFGEFRNEKVFAPMNGPAGDMNKNLGPVTERQNNGKDHGPSFADKNPGALSTACKHVDNPFFWTGRPGKGK